MDSADLHMHSRHSDGEWAPARLVREAKSAGLRAIALTDHDTLTGLPEARAAGAERGVEVISGVEISTWAGLDYHVLAYGFDPEDEALGDLFTRARGARRGRAEAMVQKLAELGKPVSMEAVLQEAGDGAIGRPHVARALIRAGHVSTFREAFDVYLGDGKPACVDKLRVTPPEAVDLVRKAGGVTVAAHPGCYGGMERIEEMAGWGLDGIEVDHGLHDEELTRELDAFARSRGLLRTGGSDFHGPWTSGAGVGSVRIPYDRVEELLDRVARRQAALAEEGA